MCVKWILFLELSIEVCYLADGVEVARVPQCVYFLLFSILGGLTHHRRNWWTAAAKSALPVGASGLRVVVSLLSATCSSEYPACNNKKSSL